MTHNYIKTQLVVLAAGWVKLESDHHELVKYCLRNDQIDFKVLENLYPEKIGNYRVIISQSPIFKKLRKNIYILNIDDHLQRKIGEILLREPKL